MGDAEEEPYNAAVTITPESHHCEQPPGGMQSKEHMFPTLFEINSGSMSLSSELLRVQDEPLQALLRFADTWHALPAVSDWVVNTIEKGYMLQFACRPPPFGRVVTSEVSDQKAPVL
ncbi:hypothetical protein DPX16_11489 [Anabarilius grahami]|uniref:Uncharacterized protein n=1 Tax=Anabarilius grahami TaxID=495550 RepID=A0A3N0YI55_ANAGA|nr:hypothetical protein DPX16_11489 [Anabarilius grahami]